MFWQDHFKFPLDLAFFLIISISTFSNEMETIVIMRLLCHMPILKSHSLVPPKSSPVHHDVFLFWCQVFWFCPLMAANLSGQCETTTFASGLGSSSQYSQTWDLVTGRGLEKTVFKENWGKVYIISSAFRLALHVKERHVFVQRLNYVVLQTQ